MVFNIHAGHNPDGMIACGAIGQIKESTEARAVKDRVISLLRANGHTVYDCTCNNGANRNDVLNKIVAMCNSHTVDLDVSIHFNSASSNAATGTEVWIYPNGGAESYANRTVSAISALGFRNRGVKTSKDLYVLRKTKAKAMLIECCFVNDPSINLYNADSIATAIVQGITGQTVSTTASSTPTPVTPTTTTQTTYYPRYMGSSVSIVSALNAIGVDSSMNNRKKIASLNGIANYSGTASQNTQMLNLLKQGKLKSGSQTVTTTTSSYYPRYTGSSGSIVSALKAIGVDSSMTNRKKIAAANGISGYRGTASQNTQMLSLLKKGQLKK